MSGQAFKRVRKSVGLPVSRKPLPSHADVGGYPLYYLFTDGGLYAGPFTIEARREILTRLLETQQQTGLPLISDDEITRINRIWAEDTVTEAKQHLNDRAQVTQTTMR